MISRTVSGYPNKRCERAIADLIGLEPEQIWPTRYASQDK